MRSWKLNFFYVTQVELVYGFTINIASEFWYKAINFNVGGSQLHRLLCSVGTYFINTERAEMKIRPQQ